MEDGPIEAHSVHSSNDSSSNAASNEQHEVSIKKDALSIANIIDNTYHASLPQIVSLGLGLTLGGTVVGWNAGLVEGFWVYFVSYTIVAIGYLMLILCLAELTSIMAFAGGAYGYIRCSVSPFLGYLMGCCEWLQYSLFVVCSVTYIGFAFTEATGQNRAWELLEYIVVYFFLLIFHIRGGRYFWFAMSVCAVLTVLTVALYVMAAFVADPNFFDANITTADNYRYKTDGGGHVFHILYYPAWFFIGCETLTISGAKIANGTDVIPKALAFNFAFLIAVATLILFITITQYHDSIWSDLCNTNFPLSHGIRHSSGLAERVSSLMTIIPNYSSALGFLYASKHLTQALSLSGLLPRYFREVYGPGQVPLRALLTVSGIQLVVLIIGWAAYDTSDHDHPPPFFQLCMLGASVSYIGIFSAYIVFAREYPGMERKFRSPVGIYGACVGIVIFMLVIISIISFDRNNGVVVGLFLAYLVGVTLYYYFVAETRQGFSIEEQKRFMRAYILNSNKKRRRKKTYLERIADDLYNWWYCICLCHGQFKPEKMYAHPLNGSTSTNGSGGGGSTQHASKGAAPSQNSKSSSSAGSFLSAFTQFPFQAKPASSNDSVRHNPSPEKSVRSVRRDSKRVAPGQKIYPILEPSTGTEAETGTEDSPYTTNTVTASTSANTSASANNQQQSSVSNSSRNSSLRVSARRVYVTNNTNNNNNNDTATTGTNDQDVDLEAATAVTSHSNHHENNDTNLFTSGSDAAAEAEPTITVPFTLPTSTVPLEPILSCSHSGSSKRNRHDEYVTSTDQPTHSYANGSTKGTLVLESIASGPLDHF